MGMEKKMKHIFNKSQVSQTQKNPESCLTVFK